MTTLLSKTGLSRGAFAALALGVLAAPHFSAGAKAEEAIPANTFYKGQTNLQYLAKDKLIGRNLVSPDGHVIGDIEDLIISESNTVEGVIVGVGGFLGMAEKKIGVRLDALKIEVVDGRYVARLPGATKEVLKAVPAYERAHVKAGFIERAAEKAKELTDKTVDSSKEAYDKAKVQAGPALEKAKEGAKEAYEKGKEAAKDAYEKGKDAAGKAAESMKSDKPADTK